MPNKTIYVKESDLPLWELAQVELGESISSVFAKFLREKLPVLDAFVHVVRSAPLKPGEEGEFAVMFAPVGPTGSGGAMNPHYLSSGEKLARFLREVGLTEEATEQIVSDLQRQPSVSVRMNLTRLVATTNFYSLHFKPIPIEAGVQSWNKVEVVGWPISAGGKRWSATFHDINRFLSTLSDQLGSPEAQLAAIRRSLLAGQEVELGGITGAQFVVAEDLLIRMGLLPSDE